MRKSKTFIDGTTMGHTIHTHSDNIIDLLKSFIRDNVTFGDNETTHSYIVIMRNIHIIHL